MVKLGRPVAIWLKSGILMVGVLLWSTPNLRAWGAKGHQMSGRVAARALPHEMPLFFRSAVDRLAYLLPEPDRWRGEA